MDGWKPRHGGRRRSKTDTVALGKPRGLTNASLDGRTPAVQRHDAHPGWAKELCSQHAGVQVAVFENVQRHTNQIVRRRIDKPVPKDQCSAREPMTVKS